MIRLPCALAVALLLTGCATAYQAKLPPADQACVPRLDLMTSVRLEPPAPAESGKKKAPEADYLEFADIAQCHADADGQRFAALYALDAIPLPAEIEVSILLSTGGTFAASAYLLDSDFQPLRHYDFDQFVRRGNEYSLHAFLNEKDGRPSYLMLTPDQDQVGKKDTTVGSAVNIATIPAGPVMFFYNHGLETTATRVFMEGGKLRVKVKPERLGNAF